MPFVLNDRVLETCTSPGTGAVSLLGTVPGYQTFRSGIGEGTNTFYYTLIDQVGTNWETGLGTYISAENSVTRNTVYSSSNNNNPVNFSTGTQNIFVNLPGAQAVVNNGATYNINSATSSTLQNIPTPNTLGAGNASAMKNRIINGAMVIDQRNAGSSVTPVNTQYTLDRWVYYASQTNKVSIQQNSGAVTPPTGFLKYLGTTSLSAYSSVASDFFGIAQQIEGYNIADFGWGTANAKTVTVSFRVYSSLTGTFGGSLGNSTANRTYPFSYSISVANTWTDISIPIPGDTTGTWLTTNGRGIRLWFDLGSGSTYKGPDGSWAAVDYVAPTGATSVVGTNGATFYITGVQLEVGNYATGFEYRQYGDELALCQRYYEICPFTAQPAPNGLFLYPTNQYKVVKRAVAALTFSGTDLGQTFVDYFGPATSQGHAFRQNTAATNAVDCTVFANAEL